jgi:hypothetical protein
MARAREMGFDTDVYHGTDADIKSFDNAKRGRVTGAGSAQEAHWFVDNPDTAGGYSDLASSKAVDDLVEQSQAAERAGKWDDAHNLMVQAEALEQSGGKGGQNVMPLMIRGKNLKEFDADGKMMYDLEEGQLNAWAKEAKAEGFDGLKVTNLSDEAGYGNYRPATHYGIFDPKNIRSRFAKFDPAKADSSDLLAYQPKVLERDATGRPIKREPFPRGAADRTVAEIEKRLPAGLLDLPTDEASRMARAREMGRTAEGYHGTDADISEFGGPTWITDDPEVGSYYAQRARARTAMSDAADDTGLYDEVMDVDEVNPFDVAEAVDPTGKNVMPLKYDQGKQLDMTSLGDAPAPEELIEFLVERGIIKRPDDIGDWLNELTVDQPTLWKAIEDWGLDRDIKNAGYDSLKIKDIVSAKKGTIGQDSVLVFDPKNIRSRFAKFDPAKAGSADILAGLGVVGAGAALSQQDGFDYGALSNVVEGSNGQRSN